MGSKGKEDPVEEDDNKLANETHLMKDDSSIPSDLMDSTVAAELNSLLESEASKELQQLDSSLLFSELTSQTIFGGPNRISYYSSLFEGSPYYQTRSPNSKSQSINSSSSGLGEFYDIHFNDPKFHPSKKFPSNYIKTTKYTILTFLPLNLFHQFRRFYNLYFLLATVLTLIPQASPVSPYGQILPLSVVICVTAVKDGIEDYRRYRADRKANRTLYTILRTGQELRVKSRHIHPGDIVYIRKGEQFPADLVLLSSSEMEGTCFIDTCELDGETNLKRRYAKNPTANWMSKEQICNVQGSVECDLPNEHLYRFHGRLFLMNDMDQNEFDPIILTNDQILLRGASLRNTSWIYGLVVYAGKDTKIYRNLKRSRLKVSSQERKLNYLVLGIFGINLLIYGLSLLFSGLWQSQNGLAAWYIDWNVPGGTAVLWQLMTYFVLYTYVIPISLFVSIEICRIVQAWFMTWDRHMRSDNGVCMTVKNSNLNEDLGAVSHVFTDKTGTLTQNVMNLTAWSVEGTVFDQATNSGALMKIMLDPSVDQSFQEKVRHFCRAIALCNTVIPSIDDEHGGIIYEAQSPDEAAILHGLKMEDVWLVSRSLNSITLKFLGIEENYWILDILEFTSERKCMSIIVQDVDGRKFIYSKGADQVMFENLIEKTNSDVRKRIQEQLFEFSRSGLRTLVVSYAEIDETRYNHFKKCYDDARGILNDQDSSVLESYKLIEDHMQLLGVTAVEDQLQDKVPETITFLLQCDIHVWMLTGDKQETAINIGYSSRLVTEDMEVLVLNITSAISLELVLNDILKRVHAEKFKHQFALIVDGGSLNYALRKEYSTKFIELCEQCRSVICCRVGPLQKSLVVKLVREKLKRICLAIGDGANDVSMIETANIGVGIAGKEGTQASRASDYSFVQFKCLKRLLAVHGRYSYLRMSALLMYSFYKNMAFILVEFWFGLYSAWSAQVVYSDVIMALFNVLFTSFLPFLIGVFEKDALEDILEEHPELYKAVRDGLYFNRYLMIGYFISAVWHSLVIFFVAYFTFNSGLVSSNGSFSGLSLLMFYASTYAISVVLAKNALIIKHWTWLNFLGISLSLGSYVVTVFLLGVADFNFKGIPVTMFSQGTFYFGLLLVIVLGLLPDYVVKYYLRQYKPDNWEILQEDQRYRKQSTRIIL